MSYDLTLDDSDFDPSEADDKQEKAVWIIEAPGKIRQMEAILKDCPSMPRNTTVVVATKGHFIEMPEGIRNTGISTDFEEFARVAKEDIVERLLEAVSGANSVYIATDADYEGNVIAVDVYDTIKGVFADPLRVKLKSLDDESIRDALAEAEPINRNDATPGRTRAIIDRLIGSGFANKNIAAGRVKSAILGIVGQGLLAPYRLYLTAPSRDETVWSCHVDVRDPLTLEIANQLSKMKLPVLEENTVSFETPLPDDMGRIMVKAGDELDMSPLEASQAMQAAYESGRLSYPRSDARGLSRSAINKVGGIAKKNNLRFDRAVVKVKSDEDTHDSPYPVGDINVNHDPKAVGGAEGIRVLIARGLMNAGQKQKTATHKKGPLAAFLIAQGLTSDIAQLIDDLPWIKTRQLRMAGNKTKHGVFKRRTDTIILEKCVENGIGRPSTYAKHIEEFVNAGLVDIHTARLTKAGEALLEKTPNALCNPAFSQAIEKACRTPMKNGDAPWKELSARIVRNLPLEIRSVAISVLSAPQIPAHDATNDLPAEDRAKPRLHTPSSSPWE